MGYLLTGEVGGRRCTFSLRAGTNPIGRSSSQAEIVLPSPTVSRLHAEILVADDRVSIRDLGAHNGTLVNGERVVEHPLAAGDEIRLGNVVLRFEREGEMRPARFSDDSLLRTAELQWSEYGSSDRAVRSRFLEALVELGEYLVGEGGEDVYADCLAPVTRLFSFRCACLLIVNEAGEAEVRCFHPPGADPNLRVSRTMIDTVIRDRRGLLVRDAAQGPLWQTARLKGIRSALVVPLLSETAVIGAVYLDQDDPLQAYDERHLYRLHLIANLVAAKISTTRVRDEMRWAGYIQRFFLCTRPRHPEDYELDSYRGLFVRYCQERGLPVSDMLFDEAAID